MSADGSSHKRRWDQKSKYHGQYPSKGRKEGSLTLCRCLAALLRKSNLRTMAIRSRILRTFC
eukprot:scaffold229395_cov22-Tisochrysis_lutea.AAC.2